MTAVTIGIAQGDGVVTLKVNGNIYGFVMVGKPTMTLQLKSTDNISIYASGNIDTRHVFEKYCKLNNTSCISTNPIERIVGDKALDYRAHFRSADITHLECNKDTKICESVAGSGYNKNGCKNVGDVCCNDILDLGCIGTIPITYIIIVFFFFIMIMMMKR